MVASCQQNPNAWYCFPTTQAYGVPEANLGVGGTHAGIDIGTPLGTQLTAIEPGTIVAAAPQKWGGDILEQVQIGGQTLYEQFLHLQQIDVHVGQQVQVGEVLGLTGGTATASPIPTQAPYSSGPHVHFAEYTAGLPEQWSFAGSIDPTQLVSQVRSGGGPPATASSSSTQSTGLLPGIQLPQLQDCSTSGKAILFQTAFGPICAPWQQGTFQSGALRVGLVAGGLLVIFLAIVFLIGSSPTVQQNAKKAIKVGAAT